jgi:hypothetical protein
MEQRESSFSSANGSKKAVALIRKGWLRKIQQSNTGAIESPESVNRPSPFTEAKKLQSPRNLPLYPIKGKIKPERKQRLYSYVEIVIQAMESHFKRIGMRDVHQIGPDLVAFRGNSVTTFLNSDFGLEENIDKGRVRVCAEGSDIAAFYYIKFLNRFAIRWFVPVGLISLLVFFQTDLRLHVLPFLAVALVIPLVATIFIIRWGIRKELIRAFQTAENMIEYRSGICDTSSVEPQHLELNPGDMLASAYYYRQMGLREKARAYFALLLQKYPWSDEANAALKELRKG